MYYARLLTKTNVLNLHYGISRILTSKLFPLEREKLLGIKTLYSPAYLGIDGFVKLNGRIKEEYGDTQDFLKSLKTFEHGEYKTFLAEDLKVLISCCQTDSGLLDDVIKFSKRYYEQLKDVPLKPYVFGPILMRLFYYHKKYKEALKLIMDEEYGKYFNQISSYCILMDILYEKEKYDEVKLVMDKILSEQMFEIPVSCMTIAMASYYKIGTEESLEDCRRLLSLVQECKKRIQLRPLSYGAGLALKLNKLDAASDILAYSDSGFHFLINNLKVMLKVRQGCHEEVLEILKKTILIDTPKFKNSMHGRKSFCYEVIEEVEKLINETLEMETITNFKHLKEVLESLNLISSKSLDEVICASPIDYPTEDTRKKQYSRYPREASDV